MARATVHTSGPVTEVGHLRCCTTCGASFRTDFERCPLDGGSVIVSSTDPLIGATLGDHYEVDALIGVGAMGRVYRAHHTRLHNKRYAVKVLFGELTASAMMRMRFAHEAESASKLDHTNIVDVVDFGCTEAGLMYLVMDLVEGPTLGAVIDQGAMSPARTIAFARQLCAGLAHAHERGIIHRDFKPDNILVAGEPGAEVLRIADFGLAISRSDGDDDDARLTTSGVLCTPAYAAPEQLLGHDVDPRTDLYAVGITMYEMLTGGVLPFARGSQDVMLWKVTSEWPAVSSRAPHVPAPLARLIRKLLSREPADRPSSASEVIELLDAIPTERQRRRSGSARRRGAWLASGLGALCAVTLVAIQTVSGDTVAHDTRAIEDIAPEPVEREPVAIELAPRTAALAMPPEDLAPEDLPAEDAAEKPARRTPSRSRPEVTASVDVTPATSHPPPPRRTEIPSVTQPVVAAPPPASRVPVPAPPVTTPVATSASRSPARPQAAKPAHARIAVRSTAPPRIVDMDINGALSSSVVRRAIVRVVPAMAACAQTVGSRVVTIGFSIDETRRAVGVRVGGTGASCVAAKLTGFRAEAAPDVGDVTVEVHLAFGGS